MWGRMLFPTMQDIRCIFIFIVASALSYLFSYFFIMGRGTDGRIKASVLIYGNAQSLIGFMGGFYIAKTMYLVGVPRGGYECVKPDNDEEEEAVE